eukprot:TRINITY_DN8351_c0_g1_i1.p2 TRINITY_DN8351_c0_g1~~TRINITY_DN8351_c0_g1_i1.p2  ORF type:complete len:205 (+),score=69.07 TRINITY_DN8351_c0_g1_i1:172-786(+)
MANALLALQGQIGKLTEERDLLLKGSGGDAYERLREENELLKEELSKEKESNNFLLKSISDAEHKEYQYEEIIKENEQVFNETLAKRISDTKAKYEEEYNRLKSEYEEYKRAAAKEIARLKQLANSANQETNNIPSSKMAAEIVRLEEEIYSLSEEYDTLSLKIKSKVIDPSDKYAMKQRLYQITDCIQEKSESLIALKERTQY